MRVKKIKYLLYIPAVILAVISMYPMLWTFCGAITKGQQAGRISILPEGVSLENITTVLVKYNFLGYIKNTFIVAVVTTAGCLFVSSLAAYALARLNFRFKNQIFLIILMVVMIPFSVTMIPLFIIVRSMHMTNSLWALIIPSLANASTVFLLRQFYLGIPRDLEDAAKVDGLSHFGIYCRIIVPLSKSAMLSCGLLVFNGCWNSYLWPLIVNSKSEYWTVAVGLAGFQGTLSRGTDWNMILSGAALSMLPMLILFILFQRMLVEGIKMTGISGV